MQHVPTCRTLTWPLSKKHCLHSLLCEWCTLDSNNAVALVMQGPQPRHGIVAAVAFLGCVLVILRGLGQLFMWVGSHLMREPAVSPPNLSSCLPATGVVIQHVP